jgi:hypothetical protein
MDRQARTRDTVLVKRGEMTSRSQTLPWWLVGGGEKTTENKIHWPRWQVDISRYFCWGGGGEGGVTRVDRVERVEGGGRAVHPHPASWAENSIITEGSEWVAISSLWWGGVGAGTAIKWSSRYVKRGSGRYDDDSNKPSRVMIAVIGVIAGSIGTS